MLGKDFIFFYLLKVKSDFYLVSEACLCVCDVQLDHDHELNDSTGSLRTLSGNSLSNFLNDLVLKSTSTDKFAKERQKLIRLYIKAYYQIKSIELYYEM